MEPSIGGTGLGLFISKNIIERHGGRIWATNNNEDVGGSTFTFSIPISRIQHIHSQYLSNEICSRKNAISN